MKNNATAFSHSNIKESKCPVETLPFVRAEYSYTTHWLAVPVDHFSNDVHKTFKIKYLVNDKHWDRESGPVFFYTGNEGRIELFAKHTGFMWDIAEEFSAKLVFAEHRYYGESMPFGNKSLDNHHIGFLTSSQVLADYAALINFLQKDRIYPKYPVVVFGGSYGGMLSAYFRMKYPHLAVGAIASSAPVHMFPGMVPCDTFYKIMTSSFREANENCVKNIRKSWSTLRNFTKSAYSSAWLKKNWRLCDPPVTKNNVNLLIDFLKNMYRGLAMANYPFPSDFLVPLPANPVRVVCQYLEQPLEGEELLEGIGNVLEVYTNYENKNKCVDYTYKNDVVNSESIGWGYQSCTEMVMPMCTTGVNDMFEPIQWFPSSFAKYCHDTYNVYPQPDAARINYGGDMIQAASNIVFSNGQLDPWSAGGILSSNIGQDITAVVITGAAHHVDLMAATDKDPIPVCMARNIHKQKITQWIEDFRNIQRNRVHWFS